MKKRRLPIGLIIISVYLILNGISSIIYSFIVFKLTSSISRIGITRFPGSTILLIIALILIGLLNIILGYKLFSLSRITKRIIPVLCIVSALGGYGTGSLPFGVINSVIWFVIYCYLRFNIKAKAAFE